MLLEQRKNAKEIEQKRYDSVHEERVLADKTEKEQQGEIKQLKAELSKVNAVCFTKFEYTYSFTFQGDDCT